MPIRLLGAFKHSRVLGLGGLWAVVVVLALPGLGAVGRADSSMCGTTLRGGAGVAGSWTAFGEHCPHPSVVIDSGPSGTTSSTGATFEFRSPEGGSVFECSLDGGAWGGCASPKAYSGLGLGQHSFRVQAAYDWDPGAHGLVTERTWVVESATPAPPTGNYPQATFAGQALTDRSGLGVNVSNGNLLVENDDLGIAGTGLDLEIGHVYNSLSESVGSLGRGWGTSASEDVRIRVEAGGSVVFHDRTGAVLTFSVRGDGTFESPPGLRATLRRTSPGVHELAWHETGERLVFASYGHQGWGLLIAHRDRYANTIRFGYIADKLESITDTQGRVVAAGRDGSGRLVRLTDPTGRSVRYAYDAAGRLATYTDAAGRETLYGYDSAGRLSRVTTPGGRVTLITYDAQRRVASVVRATDSAGTTGPTTRFAYGSGSPCSAGETKTVVSDPLAASAGGHTSTYCSDARGRVTRASDSAGKATTVTYGATGDVASVRRPLGGVDNYGWDPVTRNLLCVQRGATSVGSCETSGGGLKTTFAYASSDALTRHFPTRVTDPQGNSVTVCYNGATPSCGAASGPAGSVQSVTNGLPSQNVSRFSYDSRGNTTSAVDARGFATSYGYDAAGNLTRMTPPAGAGLGAWGASPDALSRPRLVTDGKGQTATYTYDGLDRPTRLAYPGGLAFGWGYDRDGNTTSLSDPSGTSTYSYDRLGRLDVEQFPGGTSNSYGYDAASNLTRLTDGGGTTTYAYDGLNRLRSLEEPGAPGATSFAYNADGARTQIAYPSGVTVVFGFDLPTGRVTSVSNTAPDDGTGGGGPPTTDGRVLRSFSYGYRDPSGRDTELFQTVTDERGNRTTNTYDAAGRLTQALTSGGPDPSSFSYIFDGEGNRTRETSNHGSGAKTTSWAYDSAGLPCWRADGVYQPDCASEPVDRTLRVYSHDPNGSDLNNTNQRFTYNAAGQAATIKTDLGTTSTLAYRGPGQAQLTRDGTYTVGHNLLGIASRGEERYTRTEDGTLLSRRGPAGRRDYLYDGQGSVVGLANGNGDLTTSYDYDPYGHPPNLTSLGDPNPFGYLAEYMVDVATAGVQCKGAIGGGPRGIIKDPRDARPTQLNPPGPNGAPKVAGGGKTALYRAVGPNELEDIKSLGRFRVKRGGTEGKYFFNTPEQASNFARMVGDKPYTTTSTLVSPSQLAKGQFINPAREGPGRFFSTPDVPSGPVNIFDRSVLP